MSKSLSKDSVILASIMLSKGTDKHFTDLELAKKLSTKRDNIIKFFDKNDLAEIRSTKVYETQCECGGIIDVSEGIEFTFCKKCGKRISNIAFREFGLDIDKTIQYLKEKFLGFLKDYNVVAEENNKFLLEGKDFKISVLISTEKIGLNDLYILKGWSKDHSPDSHVLIGFSSEFTLSTLSSRGDIGLLTLEKIFDKKLYEKEFKFIERSISEKKKELELKLEYKETKELIDIEEFWKDIIQNIEIYALQKGKENSKVQGEKFQEYVVDLLRITLFNAKLVAQKNQPDGVIFIIKSAPSLLMPLEIKTYKGGKLPLQKHENQIRKYLTAYTNDYVTSRFKVPNLIIFAYDFDLNNKKDEQVIKTLEKDFSIKVVLFPLKSLIHLVKLYFKYKISVIDNDKLEDFFQNSYIKTEDVDKLMNNLKVLTEEYNQDLFKKTEEVIKSHGY